MTNLKKKITNLRRIKPIIGILTVIFLFIIQISFLTSKAIGNTEYGFNGSKYKIMDHIFNMRTCLSYENKFYFFEQTDGGFYLYTYNHSSKIATGPILLAPLKIGCNDYTIDSNSNLYIISLNGSNLVYSKLNETGFYYQTITLYSFSGNPHIAIHPNGKIYVVSIADVSGDEQIVINRDIDNNATDFKQYTFDINQERDIIDLYIGPLGQTFIAASHRPQNSLASYVGWYYLDSGTLQELGWIDADIFVDLCPSIAINSSLIPFMVGLEGWSTITIQIYQNLQYGSLYCNKEAWLSTPDIIIDNHDIAHVSWLEGLSSGTSFKFHLMYQKYENGDWLNSPVELGAWDWNGGPMDSVFMSQDSNGNPIIFVNIIKNGSQEELWLIEPSIYSITSISQTNIYLIIMILAIAIAITEFVFIMVKMNR